MIESLIWYLLWVYSGLLSWNFFYRWWTKDFEMDIVAKSFFVFMCFLIGPVMWISTWIIWFFEEVDEE